jgi:hypothetical protein
MIDSPRHLLLTLGAGPDADDEELAELGLQLRNELLELDVEGVDPVRRGTAPAQAKGDPITLAALAVTLAPIALTKLIEVVQAWVTRHEKASVMVESGGEKITITGSPSKEQQRALETFIGRNKA